MKNKKVQITENEKIFMKIAEDLAEASKCSAKKVACLFVKNNCIVATGVNGTFSGKINCNDIFKKINGQWFKKENNNFVLCKNQNEHHEWSLLYENHAEINALCNANKLNIDITNCSVFVTFSPCKNCTKTLYFAGIRKIFYRNEYDDFNLVKKIYNDINFIKLER